LRNVIKRSIANFGEMQSSWASKTHNLKVAGSNPAPATKYKNTKKT